MLRLPVATLVGLTMLSSAMPAEAAIMRDAGSIVSLHGRARPPAVSLDDLITRYELGEAKVYAGSLDVDRIAVLTAREYVVRVDMTGSRQAVRRPKARRRRGPVTFDSTLPLPITRGGR